MDDAMKLGGDSSGPARDGEESPGMQVPGAVYLAPHGFEAELEEELVRSGRE